MWTSPHTQHLSPGWAGQEEPEESRGLSSCPWHHPCERTASPAQMEGLEARTQASPRLWCDLAKSPSLPCPDSSSGTKGLGGNVEASCQLSHLLFQNPSTSRCFPSCTVEPETAHVPLGGAPTDFSPAGEPVQSCQLSATSCPLQGGGKRGQKGVAGREPHPHHMLRPLQTQVSWLGLSSGDGSAVMS